MFERRRLTMLLVFATAMAVPFTTLADDGALDRADPASVLAMFRDRKWAALIGLGIFAAIRFIKSDVKPTWLTVPARWRIWVVWLLGIGGCVADKVAEGIAWRTAVENMAIALFFSVVVFHESFIASVRAGKEIPVPFLTIPGARPSPTAPATKTPPDPAPVVVPADGEAVAVSTKRPIGEPPDEAG